MSDLTIAPVDAPRSTISLRRVALVLYAAGFYAFLYVPILLLVVLSFNDSQTVGLPLKQFTLRWYDQVFHSPDMLRAIGNSVMLGIVSAVVATGLALMLALGFRHDFPGKGMLMKIILMPMLIPGIVGGVIYLI